MNTMSLSPLSLFPFFLSLFDGPRTFYIVILLRRRPASFRPPYTFIAGNYFLPLTPFTLETWELPFPTLTSK